MVTINYEPLEHLPYIAEHISPEERAHVEQLIAMELSTQFNNNVTNMVEHTYTIHNIHQGQLEDQQLLQHNDTAAPPLHPLVDQLLPLPPNRPNNLLNNMERQRYEEDLEEEDEDTTEQGIDLSRYTGFISSPLEGSSSSESQNINYNNLYTTLEYAHLQERNLRLLQKNQSDLSQLQMRHLQELQGINQDLQGKLTTKRQMTDEVESTRKRRQVSDFKPVNEYFHQKWKEGISSAVELSIEAANMKQQE